MKNIQPWDLLLIETAGGTIRVVVIRVYDSGRLKVRCSNGHIIVIEPDCVTANLGYRPSDDDMVLKLLIKY